MVPKDGLNLYMAGVEGWVLPERELSETNIEWKSHCYISFDQDPYLGEETRPQS